jgi:hypothetical protein
VLFRGPVDTAEQRDAVPPAFREKLERIRVRTAGAGPEGGRANPFGGFPGAEPEPEVQ